MKLDFTDSHLTIIVAPVDLRSGYARLAVLARALVHVDVETGSDVVAFVNKDRTLCKLIWRDDKGACLLTRRLHRGRFERLLAHVSAPNPGQQFCAQDFARFFNGEPIFERRERLII